MELTRLLVLSGLALTLIYTAYTDLRYRVISNITNLTIAVFILLDCLIYQNELRLDSFFITFGLWIALYSFGIVGGGDVKLASVLALSIDIGLLLKWHFIISLVGAVLALATLLSNKLKKRDNKNGVAYGVAIIFGFLITIII